MPKTKIERGDFATIKAEVTRVSEDGETVTIWIPGHTVPVTIGAGNIDSVEKPAKGKPKFDRPD